VVAVEDEVVGEGDHLLGLIQFLIKVCEHRDAALERHAAAFE
jgi:hypothetical protein